MLTVATIIRHSEIHGFGCFAAEKIEEGSIIWVLGGTDEVMRRPKAYSWEWVHCYRSHLDKKKWILPRDNAAWMNFSDTPNLGEGKIVNQEPCLIAARDIYAGEELTVGLETDADAAQKIQ